MSLGLDTKFSILRAVGDPVPNPEPSPAQQEFKGTGEPWQKGMLRTSSYTIYVDLPDDDEEMLLVHGYTGAYDKVSRTVATYLRSRELRRPPKPLYGTWSPDPTVQGQIQEPTATTMEVLKRRGYLTAKSPEEEEDFFSRIVSKIHQRRLRAMPDYIIMPTYNCNLRCAYCFQDYMRTNPRFRHLLRTMEPGVVDRIFDAMIQIEDLHGFSSGESRKRNISFFGGEPLLALNRRIIDYIFEKTHQIGTARFSATSNATELDAYEDLLSPEGISSIQVTIDGPPHQHDRRRVYANGSGSFDKIAGNIAMALERRVFIGVRINLDRTNLHELPQLVAEIKAHGWDRYPNFGVYAAPIRAENENVDRKTTMTTWELDRALVDMRKEHPEVALVSPPDNGIKSHVHHLLQNPEGSSPRIKESFCGAHTGMYIFDSFADIYSCWDRTGDPNIRIGRIMEDGRLLLNADMTGLWRERTVASNPVCRKCRYALHCGGGCAILAEAKSGTYYSNYCDGFASRFRAAVAESYVEYFDGKDSRLQPTYGCA